MDCKHCGASEIVPGGRCPYCGCLDDTPRQMPPSPPQGVNINIDVNDITRNIANGIGTIMNANQQAMMNNYYRPPQPPQPTVSQRSRWAAFFICLMFGYFGIHRFYIGKPVSGLVWMFTFGLGGLGWLADILLLLFGNLRDGNGLPLK